MVRTWPILTAPREIFGPILLLIPVKDVDEAIAFIRNRYAFDGAVPLNMSPEITHRNHPLAVYVFSQDKEFQDMGKFQF